MYSTHTSFRQPADVGVRLWRYMDTSKYLALLQDSALFFSRADLLGDPFEGSLPIPNAERLRRAHAIRSVIGSPFAGMSEEAAKTLRVDMSRFRKENRLSAFINCWHQNDVESVAMWSLYGKANESICITTTFEKLGAVLPSLSHLGLVRYLRYELEGIDEESAFNFFMTKRASFAHEQEVRSIIWTGSPAFKKQNNLISTGVGIKVPINLDALVSDVFVNPTAPEWYRELVENVSRRYGLERTIRRSSLSDDPVF
ncbi:DUF2971 domain-containing protein [Mesorhizobium sp.]|uniref:DUF2971 domain-containing protein n=1 Tax=Mesorhizobium sp. TaxID=1871066 RepID=UPI00120B9605|nr:DUF2971 domain-containing protein [Mesorhizobium sp.]TIP10581.1 MAG: DUF2971 domain-containing protein [Mesorhizobium sp.]